MSVSAENAEEPGPAIGAAAGILDLTVEATGADQRALARFNPYRSYHMATTLLARLGAGALAAFATVGFVVLTDPDVQLGLTLLSTGIFGGLFGIAAYRFAMERAWKHGIARDLAENPPSRLRADGHTLTMDNEEIGFHVRLSSVSRVAETKTHLVLFKRRTPFLAIPKTAFARPDDATAFARFLGRMIAPAGQTPYPPETRHE